MKNVCRILSFVLVATNVLAEVADQQVPATGHSIDLEFMSQQVDLFAPGVISTGLHERDIAISNRGDELIFSRGTYDQSSRLLASMKREGQEWSGPTVLSFSGVHNDIEPFFSPDGERLFFASNRPGETEPERTDYNIWYSRRTETGWDEPTMLGSPINTSGNEFYPAVASNSNLYFTASRDVGVGGEDIYLSRFENGQYTTPVPLDTNINGATDEFNAYVSPDERLIIFSSFGRTDGTGGGDLYACRKDDSGQWQEAVNLGSGINSKRLDYCPFVDFPRGNFYFTSNRSERSSGRIDSVIQLKDHADRILNGMGNIYRVRLSELGIGEPPDK